VAYQGEPGAFGEEAVAARWGGAAEAVPVPTFQAVVDAVATGRAALGVLPLENSIAGPVAAAHAALAGGRVVVVDEVRLVVRQCLLAPPGSTLHGLRTVESHPVALAQCGEFLRRHPQLRARAVEDTAGAARAVAAAGDRRRGAIAGRLAAARYGLELLAADVHDRPDNETRFAIVAPAAAGANRW
jgi:prephenate dehydratase